MLLPLSAGMIMKALAVDTLRRLRLSGSLRCSVHCFNDMRILGSFMRYPYDSFEGRQALEVEQPEWVARKFKAYGISSWVVTGSVAGSKAKVRASCGELKQAFKAIAGAKLNLVDARYVCWAERIKDLLPSGRLFDPIKLRTLSVCIFRSRSPHGIIINLEIPCLCESVI